MIKKYWPFINETKTHGEIIQICARFGIYQSSMSIREDGTVDVNGHVTLSYKKLSKLPLRFGTVTGDFYCQSNFLKTLEGCPSTVGGTFRCDGNDLTTLEGCPSEIGKSFYTSVNDLTTFKGGPSKVGGDVVSNHNYLKSFEGFPESVGGNIHANYNPLKSFEGFPTLFRPDKYMELSDTPINEIYTIFETMEAIPYINETNAVNPETMEVYYIALVDVWNYLDITPTKPEDIKLRHFKLVV